MSTTEQRNALVSSRGRQAGFPITAGGRRAYAIAVLFAATYCVPAFAVGRATPDELRREAAKAGALLAEPEKHYRRIVAVLIKPGLCEIPDLVDQFEAGLAATPEPQGRVALHFLLSKAHYWHAFHLFRKNHERTVFTNAAPAVVLNMLSAFGVLDTMEQGGAGGPSVADVEADLRALLCTNLYGSHLSPGLKRKCVQLFIDVLKATDSGTRGWPPEERGKVYSHLGIGDRLVRELPAEIPGSREEVRRLLLMTTAVRPKQALVYADALRERLDVSKPDSTDDANAILRAYGAVDRQKAMDWLGFLASRNPRYNFQLYSAMLDAGVPPDEANNVMTKYFAWAAANPSTLPLQEAYARVVALLTRKSQYEQAASLAETGLTIAGQGHSPRALTALHLSRAKCLHKLGRHQEAQEAGQMTKHVLGTSRFASEARAASQTFGAPAPEGD